MNVKGNIFVQKRTFELPNRGKSTSKGSQAHAHIHTQSTKLNRFHHHPRHRRRPPLPG